MTFVAENPELIKRVTLEFELNDIKTMLKQLDEDIAKSCFDGTPTKKIFDLLAEEEKMKQRKNEIYDKLGRE